MSVREATITQNQLTGTLPAPEDFGRYEDILAGSAERMLLMAEIDLKASIRSRARAQWLDFSFRIAALLIGVVGVFFVLCVVLWLVDRGDYFSVVAVAAITMSAIIIAFVIARLGSKSAQACAARR